MAVKQPLLKSLLHRCRFGERCPLINLSPTPPNLISKRFNPKFVRHERLTLIRSNIPYQIEQWITDPGITNSSTLMRVG
ncbi:hypothetical protein TNCT_399601 [Trichonephila clavata]|uniref:Uncharacterized protein n=1 Tax=Trichonephila clavata TaxID=2740835 RepID=A0A8X6KFI3_TRICU|nr:hypothetical protein TNCT_399601 [Trichonephila clavata]